MAPKTPLPGRRRRFWVIFGCSPGSKIRRQIRRWQKIGPPKPIFHGFFCFVEFSSFLARFLIDFGETIGENCLWCFNYHHFFPQALLKGFQNHTGEHTWTTGKKIVLPDLKMLNCARAPCSSACPSTVPKHRAKAPCPSACSGALLKRDAQMRCSSAVLTN